MELKKGATYLRVALEFDFKRCVNALHPQRPSSLKGGNTQLHEGSPYVYIYIYYTYVSGFIYVDVY